MKILIDRFKKNSFLKNVATLALGTIVSQSIVICVSPVLTRIYSVEDFGILSLFTSIGVFLAVLTTGRYELAVVLPNRDSKAREIVQLIITLGLLVSLIYGLLILGLTSSGSLFSHIKLLQNKVVFLLPIYTFLTSVYTAIGYWFQRKKMYKRISIASTIQAIATAIFSMLFGWLNFQQFGLIFSLILAILVSTIYLFKSEIKYFLSFSLHDMMQMAKRYVSFPKFMLVSDLSLSLTQQFIPVIFATLFSTLVVGYYAMANRILRLPIIVMVGAISNVFRNEAIEEIMIKGNCKELYISTVKKLSYIGIPVFLLIFFIGPFAFQIVFGPEWKTAGVFSRVLCILLFTEFIAVPLNSLFYIREKQNKYMRFQLLNAFCSTLAIYLGYKMYNSAYISLVFFCVTGAIFNSFLLFQTYKLANYNNS